MPTLTHPPQKERLRKLLLLRARYLFIYFFAVCLPEIRARLQWSEELEFQPQADSLGSWHHSFKQGVGVPHFEVCQEQIFDLGVLCDCHDQASFSSW